MTAEQFAYWLQGFVELDGSAPTDEQWQGIKDHLTLVFKKETPVRVLGPNVAQPATPKDHPDIQDALRRYRDSQQLPSYPPNPFLFDPSKMVLTC